MLDKLPDIIARLKAMAQRFATTLATASVGFISDRILDQLSRPGQLGATRVGGISLDSPRARRTLAAVAALAPTPKGFTIAELTDKIHAMTGQTHADYSIRQAAYDLRKLRAKNLVEKPGTTRRYQVPPHAPRTVTAHTTIRDHMPASLLAAINARRVVTKTTTWTNVEHDYETLRTDMQTLFADLGIAAQTSTIYCRWDEASSYCRWEEASSLSLLNAGLAPIRILRSHRGFGRSPGERIAVRPWRTLRLSRTST